MKEVDKRFGVDLAGLNTLIPEAEIMPGTHCPVLFVIAA
jgi:hypothetical protein